MEGSLIFSNNAMRSENIDLQEWLKNASKEERVEMARQIASTLEKPEDEISYIDTANLEDMAKEERTWIAGSLRR